MDSPFKSRKIGFSILGHNMWLIHFNGAPTAKLMAASQSTESGN
jgi:hypothetical protein